MNIPTAVIDAALRASGYDDTKLGRDIYPIIVQLLNESQLGYRPDTDTISAQALLDNYKVYYKESMKAAIVVILRWIEEHYSTQSIAIETALQSLDQ